MVYPGKVGRKDNERETKRKEKDQIIGSIN